MRNQHDIDAIRDQLHGLSDAEKIAFWEERMQSESLQKSDVREPHWLWSSQADRLILFPLMYVLRFLVLFPIALGGTVVAWFFATSCVANIIWFPIYVLVAGLSGSGLVGIIVASAVDFVAIAGGCSIHIVSEYREQKQRYVSYIDIVQPELERLYISTAQGRQREREKLKPPTLRQVTSAIFGINAIVGLWVGLWAAAISWLGFYPTFWLGMN